MLAHNKLKYIKKCYKEIILFSLDYKLLMESDVDIKYKNCLEEFLNEIMAYDKDNIITVVLYGGLVRDKLSLCKWSDIDIIIIFKEILNRDPNKLSNILNKIGRKYSIRIDLSQISLIDIIDNNIMKTCYNSEILNALALRKDVSYVLYGALPKANILPNQEKNAAIFYINNTLSLFRRYMVEFVYKEKSDEKFFIALPRIIRWVFSIIRASLRLFDIYTHPYEYSIEHVKLLFPELDFSIPDRLCVIRNTFESVKMDYSIFKEIEIFIENYIRFIFRNYYESK